MKSTHTFPFTVIMLQCKMGSISKYGSGRLSNFQGPFFHWTTMSWENHSMQISPISPYQIWAPINPWLAPKKAHGFLLADMVQTCGEDTHGIECHYGKHEHPHHTLHCCGDTYHLSQWTHQVMHFCAALSPCHPLSDCHLVLFLVLFLVRLVHVFFNLLLVGVLQGKCSNFCDFSTHKFLRILWHKARRPFTTVPKNSPMETGFVQNIFYCQRKNPLDDVFSHFKARK